eukprot:13147821-Alexandrium_andersonii.AAC.1
MFGLRARAADYGLRTDYGLPADSALDRIAGSRIILGPGKICIRPDIGQTARLRRNALTA